MLNSACVCTIGDEILIGQIIDTNSSFIANKLNLLGYKVESMVSIADNLESIVETLNNLIENHKIVVVTGGLGPTKDDITKQALSIISNSKSLIYNQSQLSLIKEICKVREIELSDLNRDQALVPDTSEVIINYRGTAPGHIFKVDKNGYTNYLISLPGVPYEMEDMIDRALSTISAYEKSTSFIYHKVINTFGIPESVLASKISDWEDSLPKGVHLAYLPSPISGVKLRLSTYSGDFAESIKKVDESAISLSDILKDDIYGYEDDTLESVVLSILSSMNMSLSIAESCTGGSIISRLVSIPNSSKVIIGGVTAYANDIKTKVLNVNTNTIDLFGAVSKECAEEMAIGIKNNFNSDYSIATTGIAGPSGGTEKKPIGLLWIAVATPNGVYTHKFVSKGDRIRNIQRFSSESLNFLRKVIINSFHL